MTSVGSTKNLPPAEDSASPSDDEKTIGGKATKEERYLVDRACLLLDQKRGSFVVAAAVDAARKLLSERGVLDQALEEIDLVAGPGD